MSPDEELVTLHWQWVGTGWKGSSERVGNMAPYGKIASTKSFFHKPVQRFLSNPCGAMYLSDTFGNIFPTHSELPSKPILSCLVSRARHCFMQIKWAKLSPWMVGFLLKCSLAELLSQVIPFKEAHCTCLEREIVSLLVLLYQLCSFVQELINAVGRFSTGGT